QAADGPRLPPADRLLPADRAGGADDRADRDGDAGDAGRLLRCDAGDRPGGSRRSGGTEDGAAHASRDQAGRGGGGQATGSPAPLPRARGGVTANAQPALAAVLFDYGHTLVDIRWQESTLVDGERIFLEALPAPGVPL